MTKCQVKKTFQLFALNFGFKWFDEFVNQCKFIANNLIHQDDENTNDMTDNEGKKNVKD
mgnify:CR=1 FL=1